MIRILEDAVVNKIAAGEVVERPASVVKELLENALDAGARRIEIELKAGGKSLIAVRDDGCGMDRQDAMLCLERHATSKIRTEDDLFAVQTLGFRGEAIPSIASVSRFELQTRRKEDDVGTRLRLEGGKLQGVDAHGGNPGTTIEVRSLFFNVPARRKFLRTESTELGHCLEHVCREALGRPDVAFAVLHDGREALRVDVAKDRAARARDLLGEHGRALVPVKYEEEGFTIEGLVSPVGVTKGVPHGSSYWYVNGRHVKDAVIRRGVSEGYEGLVPKGRFPVTVLEVRLDPSHVDVNVHPSKTEVRFQDPFALTRVIARAIRSAVEKHGLRRPVERAGPAEAVGRPSSPGQPAVSRPPPAPMPVLPLTTPILTTPLRSEPDRRPQRPIVRGLAPHPDDDPLLRRTPADHAAEASPARSIAPSRPAAAPGHDAAPSVFEPEAATPADDAGWPARFVAPTRPEADPAPPGIDEYRALPEVPLLASEGGAPLLPVPRFRDLSVIGQFSRTYLLCEGGDELVLVDQHAAHERITLHRLMRDRATRMGTSQRLLTPLRVELPPSKVALLSDQLDLLAELHLEVERFGPSTLLVLGVPPILDGVDLRGLLSDLADELASEKRSRSGTNLVDHVLATLACHTSVRANQPLSHVEMRALLASLDEVDVAVCAHGRPVAIRIPRGELEHRFHRS